MASPELGSNIWSPLAPVVVKLQDHDGDIKMASPQVSDKDWSTEVAKLADDMFHLDINTDAHRGSPMQVDSVHVKGVPVSSAPFLPPGLASPHNVEMGSPVPDSVDPIASLIESFASLSISSPISEPPVEQKGKFVGSWVSTCCFSFRQHPN